MRVGSKRKSVTWPWWIQPLVVGGSLALFIIYSTWAVFQTGNYYADPYISPFYTPCLAVNCGEAATFPLLGSWWTLSPALIVAGFPVAFRATCYYYRKAYYRAFFLDPPNCSEAAQRREPRGEGYQGERALFVVNNLHRYFWYVGVLIAMVLTYDMVIAFHFPDGWGVGIGSVIFLVNAVAFWLYSLSCHSCRHAVGGRLKHFKRHPVRYRFYNLVSRLNRYHPTFAWISLPAVVFADLYVRLVASGLVTDLRFF